MNDPLDLLTTTEAYAAVNLDESRGAAKADQIASLVSEVSQTIDDLCGPVVAREVTETHHGGGTYLLLRNTPVYEIDTVTEWASGTSTVLDLEDTDTFPQSGYLLESQGHLARLWRRSSGGPAHYQYGAQNVIVVYQAGRCADTESVPARFKRAAAEIVGRKWKEAAPQWAQVPSGEEFDGELSVFSIETMVENALSRELLPPGFA